jgi:diadenylate cyclase|tara:strand:- start:617 stop:1465 length:849 start_codon:yes stop_codon:yes gene_type:complete
MEFIEENWRAGIEILILWISLYQLYRVFRATKGALIFVGVVMILAVVTSLAFIFDLRVIAWILLRSAVGIGFALVIVFQLEMRQALARLGGSFFSFSNVQKLEFAEGLTDAVMQLSHKRIGALIALERELSLKEYSENGVRVDAEYSPELIMTIFHPMTALHDGGVIVSKNRIASAGCVFPLSRNEMSDRTLGLRHRASVGLSEETDCVCIVVSEESGSISIAMNGVLERNLKESEFKEKLEKIFVPEEEEEETDNEEENGEELDSEDSSLDPSGSDLVPDK